MGGLTNWVIAIVTTATTNLVGFSMFHDWQAWVIFTGVIIVRIISLEEGESKARAQIPFGFKKRSY